MKRFIWVYGSGSGSVRHPGFNKCFKSLFSPFQRKKKTFSEELETWYFPHSAFSLTGQWGGGL